MEPAYVIAVLSLLFVGTHIGLATERVRGALTSRLGADGFLVFYSAVAAITFSVWVAYYATHRFEGAAGPGLGALSATHWSLMVMLFGAFAIMVPGLLAYDRQPTALFTQRIRGARGITRITRHPFFVGVTMMAAAHTLLATYLVGSVFFGALALLALAGARHQDAKLLLRHGQPYADYLAETSFLPFAAIVRRRQRLVLSELPLLALAFGLAVALALRHWHESILADAGIWVITALLAGAVLATLSARRRATRDAAQSGERPIGVTR